MPVSEVSFIVIVTKMGKIINFPHNHVVNQKRGGIGIKAITLREGDEVAAALTINDLINDDGIPES